MSLSFLRRFAAGALIGAAGSFAAACGALGESRYAPAPVPPLGSGPEPARAGERPTAKRAGTAGR